MILNSKELLSLDLENSYLNRLEEDNYEFSLIEIGRMSSTRLESVDLPPVMKKVRTLIDSLGSYLDIRENDVVRLDANMIDCVEIRFASRRDIKVNLYVEEKQECYERISTPDFDEDEMYFTYKKNNRRRIMHGTMDKMIAELKAVLNDT